MGSTKQGTAQWQRVLTVLKNSEAKGEAYVPVSELVARTLAETGEAVEEGRASAYMWHIQDNAQVRPLAVRDPANKRKVLGYRMPLTAEAPVATV
jgi:hypothetical protein